MCVAGSSRFTSPYKSAFLLKVATIGAKMIQHDDLSVSQQLAHHCTCTTSKLNSFKSLLRYAQKEGALGIPLNAQGVPWDVDITARFFGYASIGWTVSEISPRLFNLLGW